MPNYTYAGQSAEGFDTETDVSPDCDLRWPIDFASTMPAPFGPFDRPMSIIEEWLWRIKRGTLAITIVDSFTTSSATFGCSRSMDEGGFVSAGDEFSLGFPSIPATFGSLSSSGPHWYCGSLEQADTPGTGDFTRWNIAIGTFAKRQFQNGVTDDEFEAPTYLNVPHMAYNHSTGLYTPSIYIEGTMQMEAGPEYLHRFQSHALGPNWALTPDTTGSCSFFPSHGGGTLSVNVYSDATAPASSITITFTPTEWYSWGGLWNTTTGAPIAPP